MTFVLPSGRTTRFILFYGAVLFFLDQYVLSPSRSMLESFAIVAAAVLLAVALFALLGRFFNSHNRKTN
jgi:hypothetical protein